MSVVEQRPLLRPTWAYKADVPHCITKSILLHILQVLLSEFPIPFPVHLGLLLPFTLALGLQTSNLLETRKSRRN